jgi:hypothetical protein
MLCAYSPTCCSSASRSTTSIRCDRRPVAAVPPALNAQTTTLRRLIGSSVVVGPASMSRRHEGPCWMAVSRWSGESRPPRWAARYKAGWGLDPHRLLRSSRRTWPAHCLLCQLAWRALCLLADAQSLPPRGTAGRGHWVQPWRDPRPLPHRAGSATPGKAPARPELVLLVAPPPTGCAAAALRCQVADSATARLRGRSPRLAA